MKTLMALFCIMAAFVASTSTAQTIDSNGCDPQLQTALDQARDAGLGGNKAVVSGAFAGPPAPVGSLSCLRDLMAQVQLSFTFPTLANFTWGGLAARAAQTIANRILTQVENSVCARVTDAFNAVLKPINDLQSRLLSTQLPGGGTIRTYYSPYYINPQPAYPKMNEVGTESVWTRIRGYFQ